MARKRAPGTTGLEITADNLTHVSRICRLVQGMPLGILLAAAWVGVLTPAEIAVEISRSLDFLEIDLRDVPERQRSMRAVFDHSWNLLSEREREVFQQMSVFQCARQQTALADFGMESENARAAWDWATARGRTRSPGASTFGGLLSRAPPSHRRKPR
jgi:predicted ATPase